MVFRTTKAPDSLVPLPGAGGGGGGGGRGRGPLFGIVMFVLLLLTGAGAVYVANLVL
jgi:hypothetical protein